MAACSLLLVPLFGLFALWCVVLLFNHLRCRAQLAPIPSPRSYPLIGHMLIVKMDLQEAIAQIFAMAYLHPSPRMVALWIGPVPTIMIYGATLLEPIIAGADHINKGLSYEMLRPWLGTGLLTSNAEQWRPRRKQLTPTFHYEILKNFLHIFNRQSSILVQKLHKMVEQNKGIVPDISPLVSLCALDIICETSMGQSVNAQQESDSTYVKAVIRINDIIQRRQTNPLMWPDALFNLFGEGREHAWALNVLHSFTRKVIVERREKRKRQSVTGYIDADENGSGGGGRKAFLDLLLEMDLSEKDIQNEVDTFMFEGHDTTSAAIAWTLYTLGTHPHIQQRVHDEIVAVCGEGEGESVGVGGGGGDISMEQLSQLNYLECCIKETLRLYPSVPMISRCLGSDALIGGHRVPANTQVVLNIYMIHRDPAHWPDPETFDPDRFLRENMRGRHSYAYVPFSAGSRNCIGQRFALLEEKTMLVWILRNFRVHCATRRDQMYTKAELILRPATDITLQLTPRQHSEAETKTHEP